MGVARWSMLIQSRVSIVESRRTSPLSNGLIRAASGHTFLHRVPDFRLLLRSKYDSSSDSVGWVLNKYRRGEQTSKLSAEELRRNGDKPNLCSQKLHTSMKWRRTLYIYIHETARTAIRVRKVFLRTGVAGLINVDLTSFKWCERTGRSTNIPEPALYSNPMTSTRPNSLRDLRALILCNESQYLRALRPSPHITPP